MIHDLIPLVFESDYLAHPAERAKYSVCIESALNSDLLLTNSNHTSSDVKRLLNPQAPVVTIGGGVEDVFFEGAAEFGAGDEGLTAKFPRLRPNGFILTISGAHKSKNLRQLLEGYARCSGEFRLAFPLVVAGLQDEPAQYFQAQWKEMLKARRQTGAEVIFLPRVSDEWLRLLYRSCRLFVFPSLYEGYGLPLAEAMVAGAVCVGSDRSSLPEVLPNAEFQFDPQSSADINEKIVAAAVDEVKRSKFKAWARERRESYRWRYAAQRLISALATQGVGEAPHARGKDSCKIAVLGPLKPVRGGVSTYNSHIIPHFDEHTTWFSSQSSTPILQNFDRSRSAAEVLPIASFKFDWMRFDAHAYVIGNSEDHIPALTQLQFQPGIVWLHDVRLNYLAWDYARALDAEQPLRAFNQIISRYGFNFRFVADFGETFGLPFTFARALLSNATGFIVHSEHAKNLLRQDFGGALRTPPIEVIPHAVFKSKFQFKQDRKEADCEIRVGTLGYMHPVRDPETIIAACGRIAASGRRVKLILLGKTDDDFLRRLRALGAARNVVVECPGFLDEEDFEREISLLDVVVQLRKVSNGESSGTVSQAISIGVPTITNIPSAIELWRDYIEVAPPTPSPEKIETLIRKCLDEGARQRQAGRPVSASDKFSLGAVASQFREAVARLSAV